MRRLLEHKLLLFIILATIGIAVCIGIFTANRERASVAENMTGVTVEPGQTAVSGMGGWLYNITHYFGSVQALKQENEQLKSEQVRMDKKIRDMQGLQDENDNLRAMLDLKEDEKEFDLTAVSVIAKDPSNWYGTFTINKGSSSGLAKNQPVITADRELVGQIRRVGTTWAEVMTILDPESAVGSIIRRSKEIGIVEGDTQLRLRRQCKLGYLARDTDIEQGDYVETSGLGGIYPKGLLIGKVMEIQDDTATMSRYAILEPSADIKKLNEVFVITNHEFLMDEDKEE